ncbi:hypothetical protein AMQ84_26070 [Paenibacillus riograndensis]|uniref:ATP-binding protein n=1 Tax=Paenibacillus riograndensis TaxID=483937 RepID=A0A132TLD5_9BACL|nr:protein DpdH [Paenibacillus riograndensis]KWX72152.1 hypothetical protein AMQ84_26070 [Paenibacillus riograndensis]
MKPLLCWQTEQVYKVMDKDALHVQQHLFLATHHPIKMYKQTASPKVHDKGASYDETTFLNNFTSGKDQVFVPILGESGTGKSHLIRWLHAKIDKRGRKVLLIPRLTNLKEIILMILEDLEDPLFEEYRQRVRHSVGNITSEQAKEILHNNITLAIGKNGNHVVERLSDAELFLMENLPHLFRDPAFIPEWFKEDGIIHQLAEHIVGGNGGRLNERREFTIQDLPINLTYINRASEDAQYVYSELVADYQLQQEAVEWINRSLDQAISTMLSLSSTDLVKIMKQIRIELAAKNIELILLIEDFTVLQGIDYQLLDALIYTSAKNNDIKTLEDEEEKDKLCNMRVALGCTTGYFHRFEDTVLTRISFRVTLDVGEDLVPPEEIERFSAKYLNALRTPEQEIRQWALDKENTKPLRSACEDCSFVESCHEAFGQTDGIGLYPFNKKALQIMYKRGTSEENFNPRLLIGKVLRYILENYAEPICEGQFPSPALFDHFGGKSINRLSVIAQKEIERLDPVHYDRRLALIELWTEEYDVVDFHPFIHEAFNLPPLHDRRVFLQEAATSQQANGELVVDYTSKDQFSIREHSPENKQNLKNEIESTSRSLDDELPQSLMERIQILDQWANGGSLSQSHSQFMRDILFEAVNDYINWDFEQINQKWFQDNGLWSKRSILFESQSTQQKQALGQIRLNLPCRENERKDTALTLQGLIYHQYYKHWEFNKGSEFLRYSARYLEQWCSMLIKQMRQIPLNNEAFDPLPLALDVLAITAAMGGAVKNNSPEGITEVLFNPITLPSGVRTSEWIKLLELLLLHREEIKSIALARLSIIKGETRNRVRMVDASIVYSHVINLNLSNLTLPPDDKVGAFDKLIKCSDMLRMQVCQVMESEHQDKLKWTEKMKETFGDTLDGKATAIQVNEALKTAVSSATLRGDQHEIQAATATLEARSISNIVRIISDNEKKHGLELAVSLGKLAIKHITDITNSLTIIEKFLEQSTKKVENDLVHLQGNEAVLELETIRNDIQKDLDLVELAFKSF